MQPSTLPGTFRFGDFELDVAAYELRRQGRAIKLGRQPMDLLILLVEGRRRLVSRTEIVDRLWGKDVFVDVDTGVNTAISKIRQALRDSPEAPAYVETVPGKGYRFIAAVETAIDSLESTPAALPPQVATAPGDAVGERPAESAHSDGQPLIATSAPPLPAVVGSRESATPARPGSVIRSRLVIGVLLMFAAMTIVGLTRLRGGGASTSVTLAVLPFANLGSDPEREYLAAGLTDETSASLAQIDPIHLSVKGRTLRYKGTTKTAAEIGQELSVDYLLESSVRSEGSRLRLGVTLIRVKDQSHVWSQFYDREPTSLLGLQQELSAAIAEQIRLRLLPDRMDGLGRRQTRNADAYDAYLRGRYEMQRRTPEGNVRAIELFNRALAIDPNYALAWSDLVYAFASGALNGDARPADVGPRATAAALNAVRANANLSESQAARGYVALMLDWDWKAAETALRLAVALDPSNVNAHRVLGHALSQAGRPAEAELVMRRARDLDPTDTMSHGLSSIVAFQDRDAAGALEHARRAIALDAGFWIGYIGLGQAYELAGDHALALEAVLDAARIPGGGNSKVISLKGYVLARLGRAEAARDVLSTLEAMSRERYIPPYAAAMVYAGLGEREAMFDALEKAYAVRDVHLIYLPVSMQWDPYRADPRFVSLLARCGFGSAR
jgi:TolB-like protein/DNA-binding winged helix-turn-helix (wHTH) protein/Flp pilus assembly protein TadD